MKGITSLIRILTACALLCCNIGVWAQRPDLALNAPDNERLAGLLLDAQTCQEESDYQCAFNSVNLAYMTALNIVDERLRAVKNSDLESPLPATKLETTAWQVLAELYLSPYITPDQRWQIQAAAAENLSLLVLIEAQYNVLFENLEHMFAIIILSQVKYANVQTEEDYINMGEGIAKTWDSLLNGAILDIKNAAKRPYTSATFYALALRSIYDLGGRRAFYSAQQYIRGELTAKPPMSTWLPAEISRGIKTLINRYGDIENYGQQERFAAALCHESIYPLAKDIIADDFNNPQNKVLKVNAALCLLNAPNSTEQQRKQSAAFIEDTYFTKPAPPPAGEVYIAIDQSPEVSAPNGVNIVSLPPRDASALRRSMIQALWQNTQKYGNKFVKNNYDRAVQKADGSVRAAEVIIKYGVLVAEFITLDLAIAAITGGTSLTVSIPRFGGKLVVKAAKNGAKTIRMFKTAGAARGAAEIKAQLTANLAKMANSAKNIPAAAAEVVKNGLQVAVTDPAFAGMATNVNLITIPNKTGQIVLNGLNASEQINSYSAFTQTFTAEINALKKTMQSEIASAGKVSRATQKQIKDMADAILYYKTTYYAQPQWLEYAQRTYAASFNNAKAAAMRRAAFSPGTRHVVNNLDKFNAASMPKHVPPPPFESNGNTMYRGMNLNEKGLINIYENGLMIEDGMGFTPPGSYLPPAIWGTVNPKRAAYYSKRLLNIEKNIPAIVEMEKTSNWYMGWPYSGRFSTTDIPPMDIKRISVFLNTDGRYRWGQLLFENNSFIFIPY
ncbi:MAG: hypothetical protein LBR90_02875 [Elusimicrobiota bacterium]|jgi:hypothetical protein|nr:hypothetical protein [Elusimicrobiota bacterium]